MHANKHESHRRARSVLSNNQTYFTAKYAKDAKESQGRFTTKDTLRFARGQATEHGEEPKPMDGKS